jgi:FKBP-type peptidyl-prolyl cis-trans isomerase FkpA
MKYLLPVLLLLLSNSIKASDKDSTVYYSIPDSLKAVQFMAEVTVKRADGKKIVQAGIKTDAVCLMLRKYIGGSKAICFYYEGDGRGIVMGSQVGYDRRFAELSWKFDWKINETYKLLISTASDSAGNFSLYSGYIFLPKENKWKLIGTCKIEKRWNTIQQPATFSYSRKNFIDADFGQVWVQRSNGSWKNMKNETLAPPIINWFGHIDSVQQRQIDIKIIEDAIASGKTDVKQNAEAVYYTMMKEGTGRPVSVNDTVTAFYKGYLFANDSVFDQTRDKPATFPLRRLIRGWQIGVPLCRVGGKIKLVIPSDLAYTIRTRAAKIPPNSILVFEIEVVDVKPSQ